MILLSIVIPIYNVEKYLTECLDSIVGNITMNYELILINDGSTDKSEDIAKDYSNKYENVKLINKANAGLSAARNTGIENAAGKYVTFIDSDDFVDGKSLELLVSRMIENDLDIIRGKYKLYFNENLVKDENKKYSFENQIFRGPQLLELNLTTKSYQIVSCTSIYRRDYLILNSIFYYEGIYFEDHYFTLKVLLNDNVRVMQTDIRYYYYRQREGSITKIADYNMVNDLVKVLELQDKYIKNQSKINKKIGEKIKLTTFSHLIQFSHYYLSIENQKKIRFNLLEKKTVYKGFLLIKYDIKQKIKFIMYLYSGDFLNYVYNFTKKDRQT